MKDEAEDRMRERERKRASEQERERAKAKAALRSELSDLPPAPPPTPPPSTPTKSPAPATPAKSPAPSTPAKSPASTDYSTPPKVAKEELNYGPLVPIPDQDQYPERKYYMIPKYHNSFGTEKYLAVAKSTFPEGGLGLFAILPIDERKLETERHQMPQHDTGKHWQENRALIVFLYLGEAAPVPIDDYKGKILAHTNSKKLKKRIDESNSHYLYKVRDDFVIDAQNPLSCYARYARKHENEYDRNAEINDVPPKDFGTRSKFKATPNKAFLRVWKDIHDGEEIFISTEDDGQADTFA
jgi:hypothetical protein